MWQRRYPIIIYFINSVLNFKNANRRIDFLGSSIANFTISRLPSHARSFPSNTSILLEVNGPVLGKNSDLEKLYFGFGASFTLGKTDIGLCGFWLCCRNTGHATSVRYSCLVVGSNPIASTVPQEDHMAR